MTNPKKVGLVFGTMLGGLHLLWSILVLLGIAEALLSFSMWAHMVRTSISVGPFDVTAALTVIVVAGIIGYVIGFVGANVWNRVHR